MVHLEPMENRRHCATSTIVTPQNDVRGTTAEMMKCPYLDQSSSSDWLRLMFLAARRIRSFTLIWEGTIISMEFLRSLLKGHFAGKPHGVA